MSEVERVGLQHRIEEAVRACGSIAEFSRKSGIAETTIRAYVRGTSEPTVSKLLAVASASGLQVLWLLTGALPKKVVDAPYVPGEEDIISSFEMVSSVAVEYEDFDDGTMIQRLFDLRMAFSKKWLEENGLVRANLFLQLAKDDSMSPTINPGDTMLIRGYYEGGKPGPAGPGISPDEMFNEEGIFYVRPEGGKHAIRRLQTDVLGGFLLSTDNPNRPDINVPASKLKILGRVEWIGRRL